MAQATTPLSKQSFSTPEQKRWLKAAARAWGLQTEYTNADGEAVEAPVNAVVELLQELSKETVDDVDSLKGLIRRARKDMLDRRIEPVSVVWDGEASSFCAWLTADNSDETFAYKIDLEDGRSVQAEYDQLETVRTLKFENKTFIKAKVPLPADLPTGYHRLSLKTGESALIVSAPRKARLNDSGRRKWGVFAPLYGLRSDRDWGIGDLADMEKVQRYLKDMGGSFFGTLPLLASSSEGTDWDPSPYSPVSRLFWNEIFLDVESLVRESTNEELRKLLNERSFREDLARLREVKNVDYPGVFAKKRRVLTELAKEFFASGEDEDQNYRDFLWRSPHAEAYARFRAGDDDAAFKYHLYVQYQMDQQLLDLSQSAKAGEIAGLYMDFPVGVSRGGFDSKEFASRFLLKVSAGAPPDPLFPGGQNWGFAPLHPVEIRTSGYDYFIQVMRHHMRYASVLRLDHIMAFHRIYAIPEGIDAKSGVYIRYRSEEFFAILNIESERFGVRIVGEDLGTVPAQVREALKDHDLLRMWVLPFEAGDEPVQATAKSLERSLACLNTHDMVPFAGYRKHRDIELFDELDVIDDKRAQSMKDERKASIENWMEDLELTDESELMPRVYELLAAGPSELLLITLEDLWAEEEPQNIPGTWKEYPNWQRRLGQEFGQWSKDPQLRSLLQRITELRSREPQVAAKVGKNGNRKSAGTDAEPKNDSHI